MDSNSLSPKTIRFAVNPSVKDKDDNYELLATDFKDSAGTIQDVADHVKAGHAICAGLLGNRRRCKKNVIGSNWILVDIDNSDVERDELGEPIKDSEGKTKKIYKHQLLISEALEHDFIKKHCALIYTTASHTPEWQKFRLIFVLPEYVEGADTLEALIRFSLEKLPHDPACKDASRIFYGNTKAEFPLINPLAVLPADWVARASEAAEIKKQETEQRLKEWKENKESYREYSLEQGWNIDDLAIEALSYIPPRCPGSGNYKECTNVAMAITSHFGAVSAEIILEKWSPSIPGSSWDIGKKIRSYKGNGIGIGTLFHIAKQYGFSFPSRTVNNFTKDEPKKLKDIVSTKLKPTVITIKPVTDTPVAKTLTSKPPKGIPGDSTETIYPYSDTQWVVGYEFGEGEIEFKQYNRLPDNSIEMSKGNKPWVAYKFSEVLSAAKQGKQEEDLTILLLTHNEKQVEIAREKGIPAFTFAGRIWARDEMRAELSLSKKELEEVAIGWISSTEKDTVHEDKKLALVVKICKELGIKFMVIDAKDDLDLSTVEEVLVEVDLKDALESKALKSIESELQDSTDNQSNKSNSNKNRASTEDNFSPRDHNNPDSRLIPVCLALNLNPKNCVTYTTFESWMYNHKFARGADWITINSAYYRWCDQEEIWKHQDDNTVLRIIAESGEEAYKLKNTEDFSWVATKPYESNTHKEAAFKYNRNRLEIPQGIFSENLHLLAFNNCVVDLRTGEQLPHSKDYYLTNKCPYDYEPNKPCPEVFRNFVIDSFGEEFLSVIRAFTNAFLNPTAPYGRFPHLIGKSGGGKGTILRFWAKLLGLKGSGSASSFSDISTPEGRHQFLTGRRIFMFPDMGGYTAGVRTFYELVDNGEMSGRPLFSSVTYSIPWNIRFAVASVDYLQLENSGDGWARRAYPIPVRNRDVKPDPLLGQKLEAVKADVISWALAMNREERDRILLSPPESERAIIASLNASLHADSTRSFVDLCLRPTSEPSIVSNALLHELYKAYCKIHGYSPLGMSKFISHLKTVLPRNFYERSWGPMKDGERERIQAHWEYIHIPPDIFKTIGLNSDNPDQNRQYNPEWVCVKSQCEDGGLIEFEDFWHRPQPEGDFTPTETPEPSIGKGVQGVQGENTVVLVCGQAETRSGSDCPICPTVQGESLAIKKATRTEKIKNTNENTQPEFYNLQTPPGQIGQGGQSLPEPVSEFAPVDGQIGQIGQTVLAEASIPQKVQSNLTSLQDAILAMNWEMIASVMELWTEAMKKAVWGALSSDERKALFELTPERQPEQTFNNNDAEIPPELIPEALVGRECLVKSGEYAGRRVIIQSYIASDNEFWVMQTESGGNEYYFGVRYSEVSFDDYSIGQTDAFGKIAIGSRVQIIDPESPEYRFNGEVTHIYDDVQSCFVEFAATATSNVYGTMFKASQILRLEAEFSQGTA
jgi:putative DNA primase/helicase